MNSKAEIENFCHLWNSTNPFFLQINSEDLLWNFQSQNLVDYKIFTLEQDRFLVAIPTQVGCKLGLNPKQVHVSLWVFGSQNIQSKKLIEEKILYLLHDFHKKGFEKVYFGADEFHFLPGIPIETENQSSLLIVANDLGFQGAEVVDFAGSLNQIPADFFKNEQSLSHKMFYTEVFSPKLQAQLLGFLNEEFPGRWVREFLFWQKHPQINVKWKVLLENEIVIGFARMVVRTELKDAYVPGALRLRTSQPTRKTTDCCLGPIGVSQKKRGQGLGSLLLGLVLNDLRNNKGEEICIDWTNAINYYQALNLNIVRKYQTAWKIL